MTAHRLDVLAELAESIRKLAEQVRIGAEMAERCVAALLLPLHLLAHRHAVETVHRVAFQDLRSYVFPAEDVLAGLLWGDGEYAVIVRELRAPRMLLSMMVGGSLGLCGAAAQALTRNPLAEPAVFGTPQAAALGAVLAIHVLGTHAFSFVLPLAAFLGAWASILILMAILARSPSIVTALLAGVALGASCGAAISLVLTLSQNPFATSEIRSRSRSP